MYRIIHLDMDRNPILRSETDYAPMTIDEACELVTELTRDAIDSSSSSRWVIMSQD